MSLIVAEWTACWCCPNCKETASSSDDGVDEENEYFHVVCGNCNHEYEVYRD